MQATKAELREQLVQMTEERDHYRKVAESGLDLVLERMSFDRSAGFDAEFTGEVARAISLSMVSHFKAMGAANFLEMTVTDVEEPFQRYTVTIQKVGALSPAEVLREARGRIAELEAAQSLATGTE